MVNSHADGAIVEHGPNEEQLRAIRHRSGPLRIVAGAGAGKTETLARSVIELVQDGLARPEQILAITFTRKAAGELRDRMRQAIASIPGAIGEVDVDTYNAFGARVVEEHGYKIGLPPELTMLTEAQAWVMLWRVVDDLDFTSMDWTAPRGTGFGNSGPLSRILRVSSRLADERKDVDDLRDLLESGHLDDDPDWPDVINALTRYDARKRELGALDFGDQIRLACSLLEREDVREHYAQTYRFILVDEFQDTNYSQRAMVRALGSSVDGNIRVVGDPNQAIYGFRGAAPDNVDGFLQDFPDAETVPLYRNYRSTGQILNLANAVWAGDSDPFRGNLTSGLGKQGPKPVLAACADLYTEAAFIARQIDELRDEGVDYDNMAILVRKNAPKLRLYRLLLQFGVPIELWGGRSLLDQPEVQLLHSALRVIAGEDDDIALAHVLSSDRWGLDEASLYVLATHRDRDERLITACRRLVQDPRTPAAAMLRDCMAHIEDLAAFAYRSPITQVVDRTARSLLGALESGPAANVAAFRKVAQEFADGDNDGATLREFLVYLDLLISAGSDEEAAPESKPGASDTVKMMTMHNAKGLEWEAVFIAQANRNDLERSRRQEPDAIPPELAQDAPGRPHRSDYPAGPAGRAEFCSALEDWRNEQALLEDQRILYVALTRAREHVFISWSASDPTRKTPTTVADRVADLADHCICVEPPTVDPPDPAFGMEAFARFAMPLLNRHLDDIDELPESWSVPAALVADEWERIGGAANGLAYAFPEYARRRSQLTGDIALIERVAAARTSAVSALHEPDLATLTYTQIEQFRQCPHRWFLRFRLGLPGYPDRLAASYGTAVHEALQREAEARLAGKPGGIPRERRPAHPAASATASDGTTALLDPIDAYLAAADSSATPLLVEAEFALTLGGVQINGVIDRVHRLADGSTEIVDYKTDVYLRSEDEIRSGLQLQIYLLAVNRVFGDIQPAPARATMFFLRHGIRRELTFTADDLADAERQILEVAGRMHRLSPDVHAASPQACRGCEYRLSCRHAYRSMS